MTKLPLRAIVLSGVAATIVGFLWGALMAGVPYQDPTPEQRSSYTFHSNGSFRLMSAGVTISLFGIAAYAVRRRCGPASGSTGDGASRKRWGYGGGPGTSARTGRADRPINGRD